MNEVDHNVKPCADVDHVIGLVTLVRCGHRESYTLSMSVSQSASSEELRIISSNTLEFGPFDSLEEVRANVVASTERMVLDVQQSDGL